jgi:pimeloyl-ACP methyl ester carboxylesterase
MIPGGALVAGIYADLARQLSDQFTVVTYDPRGNSRSPIDGEPKDLLLPVVFPGDHMGYAFDAAAFADVLRRVLGGN